MDVLTKKLSSKKVKKTGKKKVSIMLKKFIKELLSNVIPISNRSLKEINDIVLNIRSIFLQLFNKIDNAKLKNEDASCILISSYI